MKNYNEILDRIAEIIKLSEQKKAELEAKGIYDINLKVEDKNFHGFHPYSIYKEYYAEFTDLINREKTYYILYKNENVGAKNQELIGLCQNLININPENTNMYEQIISILKNSNGKKAYELSEYMGYILPRAELNKFKELCQKLGIGPYKLLADAKEEFLEDKEKNQEQHRLQLGRIRKHLETLSNKNEMEAELLERDIQLDDTRKKLAEREKSDLKPQLNCDFKEIIYWGMLGYLNTKMIKELKTVMSNAEFSKLLDVLREYNLFTEIELSEIELYANARSKTITDINELVAFFAIRKDINMDGLKALIPSIGIYNYHYLIDQLFKFGAIDFDTFKEYLEENNFIEKEDDMSR